MKDIKSVMIGFLLATCMFLLMGHSQQITTEDGHFNVITADVIKVGNGGKYVFIQDSGISIQDEEADNEMQLHSLALTQYKNSNPRNMGFMLGVGGNKGYLNLYDSKGREGVYLTSANTEGDGMIQTHTLEEKIKWEEESKEEW